MFPIEECLRRIPANSETARTTNDGAFASSLLSVHEPPELTLLLPTAWQLSVSREQQLCHLLYPPPNGWESTLAALTPRHPVARRIPANSETARTTNEGAFASSLLSVHEPPELLWASENNDRQPERPKDYSQGKESHGRRSPLPILFSTGNCEAIAIAIN